MARSSKVKASRPRQKPLPSFASEGEEARYWARTDSAQHMNLTDASEEVPVEVEVDQGGNLRGIYIRLPERLLSGLKTVAARKELPYQLLVREWLAERLEKEGVRYLPDSLGENVILLRRFYIKNRQGLAPQQGWIVVRAVKEGHRTRYEAEPWWEGSRGSEKTKVQSSAEKAVEEGYRLLERLWEREFKYAPKVVRLRSEKMG
jgi:predicted DNA binding CopG/RHH family protein